MKDVIVTYRMKDGPLLHTMEELEEYVRTHELPELTQQLMRTIGTEESKQR